MHMQLISKDNGCMWHVKAHFTNGYAALPCDKCSIQLFQVIIYDTIAIVIPYHTDVPRFYGAFEIMTWVWLWVGSRALSALASYR